MSDGIIRVAILGFGTVGQGIYRILEEKKDLFAAQLGGRQMHVVTILVTDAHRPNRTLPACMSAATAAQLLTDDASSVFSAGKGCPIDVVFEAMVGDEPARACALAALSQTAAGSSRAHRCYFVTANKAMFASHGRELQRIASESGSFIGFEATVGGGVPIIKTIQNMLTVQGITKVEGILNGTTNYILSQMRVTGASATAMVAEAQAKGYAEADPTADISGRDAANKITVLSNLMFGEPPVWAAGSVVGVTAVSEADVAAASAKGLRYRHAASLERVSEGAEGKQVIVASVKPIAVDSSSGLYGVDGVDNALTIHTDYLGRVTVQGPGAGMYATASVMVEDYLCAVRAGERNRVTRE